MSGDLKVPAVSAPNQKAQPSSEGITSSGDSGTGSHHSGQEVESDQHVNHSEQTDHQAVGWMLKVRSRNDELKKYFALPPSENFLDEFHCALRKRVLLQGRMYIFDNHVCFYSNVFGFVKKRVIQLKEIVSVKRKTNFRFPNSIELEDSMGGKDFFTSFLSRDAAYKLIINSWRQACGGSKAIHKTASGYSRLTPAEEAARREREPRQSRRSKEVAYESPVAERSDDYLNQGLPELGHRPSSGLTVSNDLRASRENTFAEEDSEGESEDDSWEVHDSAPPPWGKACKLVLEADLPCSTRQYYEHILSDRNHFFEDFHQDMGDRRISMSPWRRHEQLGHVRDLSFQAPIKGFGAFGKSHTQAYQTQRFVVYRGEAVVFETSQVMNDIPYGDCFSVDVRWELLPVAAGLHVSVFLDVPFSRKCMFKSMIENGCFKQVQETCTALVAASREVLAQQQQPQLSAINMMAGEDTSSTSLMTSMRSIGASTGLFRPTLDGDDLKPAPLPSARSTMVGEVGELAPGAGSPSAKPRCGTCYIIQEAVLKIGAMSANTVSLVVATVATQPPAVLLLAALIVLQLMMMISTWWAPRALHQHASAAPVDASYWASRLQSLHSEMQLLQSRMDLVTREVTHAVQQLQATAHSN